MANTYSGDPATSDKDWVRFRIGDTGPTEWTFSDEEIVAAIADTGSKEAAAAMLLQNMAIRLAQHPNFRIGRFSEDYSKAVDQLNEKAKELAAGAAWGIWAGGVSVSDKAERDADGDRVQPSFRRGMMKPPGG